MSTTIANKVIVLTGASSGIGRATAIKLAEQNARLVITARREPQLQELAKQTGAAIVPGDISDPGVPQKLLDTAINIYGRCDALINNAGTMTAGKIEEIDIETISEMVRVNVEAVYRSIYTFLKYFKKQNSGYMVNISSVLGTKVRPGAGAYAGTKYAVEAISEALRMELVDTNIKIASIQPGLVMTELHRDWEVHPKDHNNIQAPLQPEDIADQVLHVLTLPAHITIPKMLVLPNDQSL